MAQRPTDMELFMIQTDLTIIDANEDLIKELALQALGLPKQNLNDAFLKDISGNSGAKTLLFILNETPRCIIKIVSGGGIFDSHPFTTERVQAAAQVMRESGIAPPVLMRGSDFHIEASAGISVMKDFFHFDHDLATPKAIAELMAQLHNAPIDWYTPLKERFLQRDQELYRILNDLPEYFPCWCLPWSGFDTGMLVLGVGNPNPETAQTLLRLEIESGVYEKVMSCEAFSPKTAAGKRQVVIHNDFKPDNILRHPETGQLTAIDYDLVQVGPAIVEFGLPYMMWLGSRFTSFEFRKNFIKDYLIASEYPHSEADVRAMMLDCEVNTIVAFPGLLANIYDAEVPLLRGLAHPTAKSGYLASGPNASPTGLELVDLLAEAVTKVRADEALIDRCLHDGLVCTLFNENAFGSEPLYSWLKEMQKNRMLRLFGIAETDDGELYVSEHARK